MFCYIKQLTKKSNDCPHLVWAHPLLGIRESTDNTILRDTSTRKTTLPWLVPRLMKLLLFSDLLLAENHYPFLFAPLLFCFFTILILKLHLWLYAFFALLHSPQPPAHALLSSKLCFLTSLGLVSSVFKSLFLNSSHFPVFFIQSSISLHFQSSPTKIAC